MLNYVTLLIITLQWFHNFTSSHFQNFTVTFKSLLKCSSLCLLSHFSFLLFALLIWKEIIWMYVYTTHWENRAIQRNCICYTLYNCRELHFLCQCFNLCSVRYLSRERKNKNDKMIKYVIHWWVLMENMDRRRHKVGNRNVNKMVLKFSIQKVICNNWKVWGNDSYRKDIWD